VTTEQYVLDTPVVRGFIGRVRKEIAASTSPQEACEAIRPAFASLLADPDWLPQIYREPVAVSSASADEAIGMGGGIGQWALYRSDDGSLSLFALVVPPAAETPVHDHLACGLVGLYQGTQDEEIFARRGGELELTERRPLRPGEFYALFPPHNDIHRVRTTSAETSVSIHLLTNDTGCTWRHSFDPETGAESPFRSGYANAACERETTPPEGH
jgi:3-mercaptopropionate dioxygenase